MTPASMPPSVSAGAGFYHTVVRGETLYRLAKMNNVSLQELMRVNHISDPGQLEVGRQLFIPKTGSWVMPLPPEAFPLEEAKKAAGRIRSQSVWKTITVHHSGTLQGSARLFDRDHRRRRMGGLFYHFVIGNGSYTRDGSIEVGWRWHRQVKANRPNDIQICLVGDFNRQEVSDAQFRALVALIQTLREQYGIPLSGIRKHGEIKGKHTDCPGKHFPFSRLMSALSTGNS